MQKFDSLTSYGNEITVGGSPAQRIIALFPNFSRVTTDATGGALTLTADMILGGLIKRDPAGGNRSDVTPTAALIIAALGSTVKLGQSFMFTIVNTADAAETITITAGDSVTLLGTMTIAQSATRTFLCVVTSTTTVDIISMIG